MIDEKERSTTQYNKYQSATAHVVDRLMAWQSPGVTGSHRLRALGVFLVVCAMELDEDGLVTQKRISEKIRITPSNIYDVLLDLCEVGLLIRVRAQTPRKRGFLYVYKVEPTLRKELEEILKQ